MNNNTQTKSIAGYMAKEARTLQKMVSHNPDQAEEARLISIALADPERVRKFIKGI